MRTWLPLGGALVATLVAIYPLRLLAIRLRILDQPGGHKSHSNPIPYLGGLAVLVGAAVGMLGFHLSLWRVLVLLGLIAGIGLIDDLVTVGVSTKIIGETVIAATAVALGFTWHLTDSSAINVAVSILWIVGLTNSFNLLDNMDGLSSTIAACSLLTFALVAPSTAVIALPLVGAALGFLVINWPPARMYLGDSGSLMLGLGVALCSIAAANTAQGLHSLVLLVLPVGLAIFDTSLVIASRLATGRPVQLGGRDHFSHRLRILGWSPALILATVVAASAASGTIAALALTYPLGEAWLAVPIAFIYFLAWLRMLRVDPYLASGAQSLEVYRAGDG
jgi:UDP-N-acetylmuramyl pentapeptide phosphotransferase/UDP-N-acetylglucosamine-1-phosphate transferase